MNQQQFYRVFEEQYGQRRTAHYVRPSGIVRYLQKFSESRFDAVSRLVSGQRNSVLDIGCSDGAFLFQNQSKWNRVTGVDVLSSLLKKAKTRPYGCPSRFLRKDFGRELMPFHSGSFDVCVSIATLQYVYDIDVLFDEVFRVLKSGGQWIFEVPNIAVFWRRVSVLFGRFPKTSQYTNGWDAGTIHYFTYHDLLDFCRKKRFTVSCVRSSGILGCIRSCWPDLLGADLIFSCIKK